MAEGLSSEPMVAVSLSDGIYDDIITTPTDTALKRKRARSTASTLSEVSSPKVDHSQLNSLNVPQQAATSKRSRNSSSTQNPLASLALECIIDFSDNVSSGSSSGAGSEHHATHSPEDRRAL